MAWLANRPEVSRVLHPSRPDAVGHRFWSRDWTGAASILGVVMKGGDDRAAEAMLSALELFGLGYSWGGFESLITHETGQLAFRQIPSTMVGEVIRIHIGLEHPDDLIADLEQGLAAWRAAL
jgi:cystathionine beta-lyase